MYQNRPKDRCQRRPATRIWKVSSQTVVRILNVQDGWNDFYIVHLIYVIGSRTKCFRTKTKNNFLTLESRVCGGRKRQIGDALCGLSFNYLNRSLYAVLCAMDKEFFDSCILCSDVRIQRWLFSRSKVSVIEESDCRIEAFLSSLVLYGSPCSFYFLHKSDIA